MAWGDELICMCVSGGFPLPNIYWSTLDDATKYYSAFSNKNTISFISISTASFRNLNATIVCISENPIDLAIMEIQVDEKLKGKHYTTQSKVLQAFYLTVILKRTFYLTNIKFLCILASWNLPTSWIFFSISLILNISFACLIVIFR